MFDVGFGYVPEKIVLNNITLYVELGQKLAFVGATDASKTTITHLLTININKIRKDDLSRSIGLVSQDISLFPNTVLENIRYG